MKDETQQVAPNLGQTGNNRLPHWMTAVLGLAALVLLISLVGPPWIHVAGNPAAGTPAMSLSYHELSKVMSVGPATEWQQIYFGWLGWALVAIAIVIGGGAWWRRDLVTAVALTVVALIGLIGNLFAVKGMLDWGAFLDTIPSVRIGGYLLVLGYTLLLVTGIIRLKHAASRW